MTFHMVQKGFTHIYNNPEYGGAKFKYNGH